MAGLKGGTTISGYPALHTGNIGSFNLGDVTFNNISAEHIVLGSNTKTSGTWINLLAGNGQNSGLRMREDTTDYGATIWYDAGTNTLRFTTINASADTNAISIDRATGATTFHKDILLGDANTKLQVGGNNSLKIQTDTGYLEVGPRNTSWCHFHTDRPSFYFDKDIAINGTLRRYGGARDIGTSGERWGNLYLSGNIVIDGTVDGIDVGSHTHGQLNGSNYISGGNELPNSAVFGPGKFRYQMLSVSGLWCDTLWVSSYTGTDVKGSNQIVMSKTSDRIWFRRQNYDATAWGTLNEIYHTGNREIPAGTVMLFAQASAPVGWTKLTTHNNKALRVVSGTGGGSGGSVAFTTAFASQTVSGTTGGTALTVAQMPSHTHSFTTGSAGAHVHQLQGYNPGSKIPDYALIGPNNPDNGWKTTPSGQGALSSGAHTHSGTTGGSGSGSAHTHSFSSSINMAVQYVDVILASKD